MKIKDILTKVAKGEKLTDDEAKLLSEFDPDKAANDAAAAARRKAEQDAEAAKGEANTIKAQLADLQKKLEDATKGKMTEAEQAKAEQAALKQQLDELKQKFAAKEAEAVKLARQTKVDAVIRGSGIQFVDGIDKGILTAALAGAFANVKDDELDKPEAVKPILDSFRVANKAVIVDSSGHGSGGSPGQKVEVGVGTGKPIDQMTPDERAADLKKRGVI